MADAHHLRPGISKQILPFTHQEIISADYQFNKFLINSVQNTLKGLAVGLAASIFFKRKGIIFYSAGFGLGYTYFTTFTVKQWCTYRWNNKILSFCIPFSHPFFKDWSLLYINWIIFWIPQASCILQDWLGPFIQFFGIYYFLRNGVLSPLKFQNKSFINDQVSYRGLCLNSSSKYLTSMRLGRYSSNCFSGNAILHGNNSNRTQAEIKHCPKLQNKIQYFCQQQSQAQELGSHS